MWTKEATTLSNGRSQHCHPIKNAGMTTQKIIHSSYEDIRNPTHTHSLYAAPIQPRSAQSPPFVPHPLPPHLLPPFPSALFPLVSSFPLGKGWLWNRILWQTCVDGCFTMKQRERRRCCRKMLDVLSMAKSQTTPNSGLKQQIYITSSFLWLRNLGVVNFI